MQKYRPQPTIKCPENNLYFEHKKISYEIQILLNKCLKQWKLYFDKENNKFTKKSIIYYCSKNQNIKK